MEGFFFNNIEEIVANDGQIKQLSNEDVPASTQVEFLKILQDFENGK